MAPEEEMTAGKETPAPAKKATTTRKKPSVPRQRSRKKATPVPTVLVDKEGRLYVVKGE